MVLEIGSRKHKQWKPISSAWLRDLQHASEIVYRFWSRHASRFMPWRKHPPGALTFEGIVIQRRNIKKQSNLKQNIPRIPTTAAKKRRKSLYKYALFEGLKVTLLMSTPCAWKVVLHVYNLLMSFIPHLIRLSFWMIILFVSKDRGDFFFFHIHTIIKEFLEQGHNFFMPNCSGALDYYFVISKWFFCLFYMLHCPRKRNGLTIFTKLLVRAQVSDMQHTNQSISNLDPKNI